MRKYDVAISILLFTFSLLLNTIGLNWGLPSEARNQFYPQDEQWYELNDKDHPLYVTRPWASYHPDEGYILLGLSKMKPGALDFNPHGFLYPTLSIYLTGAVLKVADILGYANPESSKYFFLAHPEEMARIYLIGRWVASIMSAFGVVLLYFCAKELFGTPTSIFSALSLAITPLWVRDSHFMVVNVPSATWAVAAALLAALAVRRAWQLGLLLSAFVAGLAASTKYPAGTVIVLTLFAILANRYTGKHSGHKRPVLILLTASLALYIIGFLIGTPYSLISFDEFVRDLRIQGGLFGLPTLQLFFSHLIVALGTPLVIVAVIGLLLAVFRIGGWEYQFVVLWVAAGLGQRLLSKEDFIRYLITALPPLAICAGIALNAAREYIARLDIPYGRVLGSAAALLLLLPTAGYSLNISTLMAGNSTQDAAAVWFDENVPKGEFVGVFGSLYFDMPPINAEKYEILDLAKPKSGSQPTIPDVIVVSHLSTVAANNWLDQAHWLETGTYRIEIFYQYPLSIWTWPITDYSNDWDYTFPEIIVYRR